MAKPQGLWSGVLSALFGDSRDRDAARRIGPYEVEGTQGVGGMGVVFRARHASLGRPAAVKVLRRDNIRDIDVARFESEARITASLSHPNIVAVYDSGKSDGRSFYAMELLDGDTLEDVVDERGAMCPQRVIHILRQLASALRAVHARGYVHRDIKPANVVVDQDDHATLVDFGLVKRLDGATDEHDTSDEYLTGSPQYMAPEMISNPELVGPQTDIYALGAVGYYLLCGEHVFEGDSVVELCAAHLHEQPLSPSEQIGEALPEQLEALLMRCLEKNPEDRPSSAAEVLDALERCACRQ